MTTTQTKIADALSDLFSAQWQQQQTPTMTGSSKVTERLENVAQLIAPDREEVNRKAAWAIAERCAEILQGQNGRPVHVQSLADNFTDIINNVCMNAIELLRHQPNLILTQRR